MTEFKWIFILFIILLIVELAHTNSLLTSVETQKALFRALKTSECKLDCSSQKRRPVCGTDGKTYESRCSLRRAARCEGRDVDIARRGSCSGPPTVSRFRSKCFEEREKARAEARKPTTGVFIPDCNKDGTFAKVQCHRATGYCWCASKDGRHIPGTSLRGERPKCRGKSGKRKKQRSRGKKPKKRGGVPKDGSQLAGKPSRCDRLSEHYLEAYTNHRTGCNQYDRATFNGNINRVFTKEYDRVKHNLSETEGQGDPTLNKAKRVVEWKFSELDKDKDNFLRFKEVRNFRRMVKKHIKPKSCAKTFINFCDNDHNKKIARSEWSLCLRVDIDIKKKPNKPPPLDRHIENNMESGRDRDNEGQDTRVRNCAEERRIGIERHAEYPNGGIFIPECTPDGKWEKVQCHKTMKICWCADQNTGTPRTATTLKGRPKCDNLKPERPMKGCPHSRKRQFLVDLMNQLEQEMKMNNSLTSLEKNSKSSKQEQIARWKYKALDRNWNGVLERKELKSMKKAIKSNSSTRKCRRRFVRYCDENGDKKVTMDEWIDCIGINYNYYQELPVNPNRRGRNPFIDQLT